MKICLSLPMYLTYQRNPLSEIAPYVLPENHFLLRDGVIEVSYYNKSLYDHIGDKKRLFFKNIEC